MKNQGKKQKQETKATRTVYIKSDELTRVDFATHAEATAVADSMGPRDTKDRRVRVSYRRRTGRYDVVVKLAKEIEDTKPASVV